jgi:hypothetical protein
MTLTSEVWHFKVSDFEFSLKYLWLKSGVISEMWGGLGIERGGGLG